MASPTRERRRHARWTALALTLLVVIGTLTCGTAASALAAAQSFRPAFASLRTPPGFSVYTMNADGSNQKLFVAGFRFPRWTADGSKLSLIQDSTSSLWVAKGDGNSPTKVSGSAVVTTAGGAISPDGLRVAYINANQQTGNQDLVVANSDGSHPTTLLTMLLLSGVAWSPDSKTLVFSGSTSNGPGLMLFKISAAGGSPVPVPISNMTSGPLAQPSYSPDGSEIVFDGNNGQAWTAPARGGSAIQVTHGSAFAGAAEPVFSPDGATILFAGYDTVVNNDQIFSVPATGGTVTDLTNTTTGEVDPAYQPVGLQLTIDTVDSAQKPVPNQKLHVVGPGVDITVSTGPTGTVSLNEPPGSYTVTPVPADGTVKPQASPDCTVVVPQSCAVNLDRSRTVDFLVPEDQVSILMAPGAVDSSGFGVVNVTVTDLDPHGNPVVGKAVQIEPPPQYLNPALICDSQPTLAYPVRLSDGSLVGPPIIRNTDAFGQIHLTMFVGTVSGDFLIQAGEPAQPRSLWANATLAIGAAGGRAQLPFELPALLIAEGNSTLLDVKQPTEDRLLAWLGQLKNAPSNDGVLNGIGFAPIHGRDPSGHLNDGVVLFAEGARAAVLSYLDGVSATAPSGLQALVIDVNNLAKFQFGAIAAGHLPQSIQFRLQDLSEWQNGAVIDFGENGLGQQRHIPIPGRGRPLTGFANPHGNDDLLYGYGPYPPFGGNLQTVTTFSQCVQPGFAGLTLGAHSPISVVLVDRSGQRAGVPVRGSATDLIPGAIVSASHGRVRTILAPLGSYTVKIVGTGNGHATLVLSAGKATEVFSFTVRRGQRGTLAIGSRRLPGVLRFGAREFRGTGGVRLRVRGLPKSLRRGHAATLTLTLHDQFGAPAGGVAVMLHGPSGIGRREALSDAAGKVKLVLLPTRVGKLKISFQAIGYATLIHTIRVR